MPCSKYNGRQRGLCFLTDEFKHMEKATKLKRK
jgi:hypothetical protein